MWRNTLTVQHLYLKQSERLFRMNHLKLTKYHKPVLNHIHSYEFKWSLQMFPDFKDSNLGVYYFLNLNKHQHVWSIPSDKPDKNGFCYRNRACRDVLCLVNPSLSISTIRVWRRAVLQRDRHWKHWWRRLWVHVLFGSVGEVWISREPRRFTLASSVSLELIFNSNLWNMSPNHRGRDCVGWKELGRCVAVETTWVDQRKRKKDAGRLLMWSPDHYWLLTSSILTAK